MSTSNPKEQVRVAIYASFASTGHAPSIQEMATSLQMPLESIRHHMIALHESRDIVLSPSALECLRANDAHLDTDRQVILMAHPFASIPLGFSVMGKSVLWWGGCAWDSFALPHLIPEQAPMLVATRCRACDVPIALDIDIDAPPKSEAVCHFLIPTNRMWDDVVHTCNNQRLFCNDACVDRWLFTTGQQKGYVMSVEQLWHFARGWYAGRLAAGYRRREPSQAKEYFRSVGLEGPFWGL